MELTVRPAMAHLDLSFTIATKLIEKAKGGANMMRIPPRIPSREPHPKPGSPSIWTTPKIQGDKARQKLIFPMILDFILLYSLLITATLFEPLLASDSSQSFTAPLSFTKTYYNEAQLIEKWIVHL